MSAVSIPALLWAFAVFFGALALGLGLWYFAYGRWQFRRTQQQLERSQPKESGGMEDSSWDKSLAELARWGQKLRSMGTLEDRQQLLQAGFRQPYALPLFLLIRLMAGLALGMLVELYVLFAVHHPAGWAYLLWPFMGFVLGVLAPKFLLEMRAKSRIEGIAEELPFFVDLLALLQGVGLSLEQSLISVTAASDSGLPLISAEMREVSRQVAIGRPRVEAMQKLAEILKDPDFRELTNLLRQIDRYGGDVAEPLREFSERLQAKRQMSARERAGKMNAKMIVVLVTTMLPGLIIITAGPAFTILVKALHHL